MVGSITPLAEVLVLSRVPLEIDFICSHLFLVGLLLVVVLMLLVEGAASLRVQLFERRARVGDLVVALGAGHLSESGFLLLERVLIIVVVR